MHNTETRVYIIPDLQTKLLIAFIDILSWMVEEQHAVVKVDQFIHYMAYEMRLEAREGQAVLLIMVNKGAVQRIITTSGNYFMVSDQGMKLYNEVVRMALDHSNEPIRQAVSIINVGVPENAKRMRRQRTRNMAEAVEMKLGDRYFCPYCKANIHINDPNHDSSCRGY